MKKRMILGMICSVFCCLTVGFSVRAGVSEDAVSQAYDEAVKIEDHLDGFDVTVKSIVSIAGQPANAEKTINIQTSGMQSEGKLRAAIDVQTSEGNKQQYFKKGHFYSNQSGKNLKYAMKQKTMMELLNYYVYLDFGSEYLSVLDVKENADGTAVYSFAASQDTVGKYADKLLEGAQEEHKIEIISLQGSVEVDKTGAIRERKIEMVYTVKSGDQPQMCILNSHAVFNRTGKISVKFPDLSSYGKKEQSEPAVRITTASQTVYATADVNVRAQNNVTSTVLGGIPAGDTIQETGYTDDGWIQISYNGTSAYVCGDYVSTTKPVIVKAMSGIMYAVIPVNVRNAYSTDGKILGTLSVDEAVSVTGYTDNNWIQVKYNGQTAYVYADYLSWNAPAVKTDSTFGGNVMNDNNYSSGYQDTESYGTVIAYGMAAVTVALDNGVTLSADKENVAIHGSLYEGAYVLVNYIGDYMYEITVL